MVALVALGFDDSAGEFCSPSLWRCWECVAGEILVPFGFETGLPYTSGRSEILGTEWKDFLVPWVTCSSILPLSWGCGSSSLRRVSQEISAYILPEGLSFLIARARLKFPWRTAVSLSFLLEPIHFKLILRTLAGSLGLRDGPFLSPPN